MTDFNAEPYWDDFEATNGALEKNYMRILFRPGYAVQARELTQIQSIIQNQIKQFGNHIFQDGSPVTGGHLTLDTSVIYVKLDKQYNGKDIDVDNFYGLTVFNSLVPRTRARVIQTYSDGDDRAILIKYLRGSVFGSGQTLFTAGNVETGNVAISNFTGTGSVVSINQGIFYVGGYFVNVAPQTIVLDPYSSTPTYRIGLEIDDSVVTESEDSALLDPAQESFNYQAPGAHRYKFNLVLAKRTITSVDDSRFFELLRVENGVITKQVSYPIYSELEKTLARRTYDESGNYATKPFRINLSANNVPGLPENTETFMINIEPGKAYVKGFEFETVGTTKISARRARDYKSSNTYNLSVYYGNKLDITDVDSGTSGFPFSKDLRQVDVHCANKNAVSLDGDSRTYYATRIGTARIRNFDYSGSANVYSTYLTDINFTPIIGHAKKNSNYLDEIYLPLYFSNSTGSYVDGILTILTGNAKGSSAVITRYDGTGQVAGLSTKLSAVVQQGDMFSISLPMSSAESLVVPNSTTFAAAAGLKANVARSSIDQTERTFLQDTTFNKNIFELPNYYIRYDSDKNVNLHRRLTRRVSFGGGNGSYVFGLAGPEQGIFDFGTEGQNVSAAEILENIIVIPLAGSNAGKPLDLTAPGRSVFKDTNNQITIFTNSGSGALFDADVYVTVKLQSVSNTKRTKTLIKSNNTLTAGDTAAGGSALLGNFNVRVNSANGIAWYKTSDVINKLPGEKQSLYVSDVIKVSKVYDSGSLTVEPTSASLDITDRYILDSGQNDNYYDHASIILKPGAQPPSGQTAVLFDYFTHTGIGHLSAKSYAETMYNNEQIPLYKSEGGKIYNLRDCIDLRPIRLPGTSVLSTSKTQLTPRVNVVSGGVIVQANTSLLSNNITPPITTGSVIEVNGQIRKVSNVNNSQAVTVSTAFTSTSTNTGIFVVSENKIFNESYIQKPTDPFELDYDYYLPRIDKVIVTKDKEFKVLTGVPSLAPQEPIENENAMAIYRLNIPAFTSSVQSIGLEYIDNRRYTMKDIAAIDQRLNDLEEFVRLKESEKDIINNPPKSPSTPQINKPIYGTLVDEFNDLTVADVNNDFASSIENGKLTCYKKLDSFQIIPMYDPDYAYILSEPAIKDKFINLPYSEVPAVTQKNYTADGTEKVQTAIIGKFEGFVTLTPESDYFYSQEHQPLVTDSIGRFYEIKQDAVPSDPALTDAFIQSIGGNQYNTFNYNNSLIVGSNQPAGAGGSVIYAPNYTTNPNLYEPTITTPIKISFAGVAVGTFLNKEWTGQNYADSIGNNPNIFAPGWIDNGYISAGTIGSGLGGSFDSGLYNLK
jgi:hypothetical protein